ncbi:MAG: methyltransferase domain-containing protein [Verrucomicrobia bacterium]|jgi:SAM-dependent methyltransferase|nr:methyltransferase domain-containing protein [Verrucomicrobiota bacterium]MBT7066091.1 methyltransferase domain-containing protein [Verrucomicrobiota bacterium]MBT7700301.1 methyltransferase domain-containing protein [Verrucomicrobiota bacterium]
MAEVAYPQVMTDLETLSSAENYKKWLYSNVEDVLGNRILEIGSGIGNMTPLLGAHGKMLVTDMDEAYIQTLRGRFDGDPDMSVHPYVLGGEDNAIPEFIRAFEPDTIVCLNVLEHVEDDMNAVRTMVDMLAPGGHLVMVLPALMVLFGDLDRQYGHFRRYNRSAAVRLVAALPRASLIRNRYMNLVGVAGWWVNHVLLKRTQLSPMQVQTFDRYLAPIARFCERIVPPACGLSLVVWIRKDG